MSSGSERVKVVSVSSLASPPKVEVITVAPPAPQSFSTSPPALSPPYRETFPPQLPTALSSSLVQQPPPNDSVLMAKRPETPIHETARYPFSDTMHAVDRPREEEVFIMEPAPANRSYTYPRGRSQSSQDAWDKALLVLIAIFVPPIAVYMCRGCSWQIILNIFLCLLFHFPGLIHAIFLINSDKESDGLSRREKKEARKFAQEEVRLAERDAARNLRRVSFA